jgi:FlaA1/EpsC-like NDP-sugar epimerase
MGAPVKIRTLAERMISLYQEPDRQPVQIEYIGLRQGEKLYEELLLDNEHVTRTNVEKVFVTKPEHCSWDEVKEKLDILRTCLDEKGDMLACLHETVPAFKPSDTVA